MKKILALASACVLLAQPVSVAAATVQGLRYVNNSDINVDYKIDEKEKDWIKEKVRSKAEYQEPLDDHVGRSVDVRNKQLSYLIENNIISRDGSVTYNSNGISVNNDNVPSKNFMNKSEFMMALYKACYGTLPSRPLAVKAKATRDNGMNIRSSKEKPIGYEGSDTSFDYSLGDYNVYVTPNVTELYLSQWVNKSIISTDELLPLTSRDIKMRGAKNKPAWDNSMPAIKALERGNGANPWGDGYTFPKTPNPGVIRKQRAQFFLNEDIQAIDALYIIEDVLRLTEDDLTKTEADLIAYKYGTSYLLEFPKEVRPTITYLIAMGVLDFENPGEFGNIYNDLTNDFAYTLLYRVKNKAGRKDISKIQLTDSDEVLMKEGFVEEELKIEEGLSTPMPETISVTKGIVNPQANSVVTFGKNVLNKFGIEVKGMETVIAENDKKPNTAGYTIVKYFTNTANIRYQGTRIKDLKKEDHKEIVSIEDGAKDGQKKITFTVHAPNSMQALASIDSRITITEDTKDVKSTINTITTIDTNKGKYGYISAKELGNVYSEIAIINSKTLKNRATGARAVLLEEHDLALVGNTIIKSKDNMVKRINGVEYYNLDMIVPLMTNAYISKLDPMKLYVKTALPREGLYPVEGSGGILEYVPVTVLGPESKDTNGEKLENPLLKKHYIKTYYNTNLLTKGVSTLIREFPIQSNGKTVRCKVIINFGYSLPRVNDGELMEDTKIQEMAEKGDEFNIKEATEYLYTRPTDTARRDWWDNNIELSNALANLMYGTNDTPARYVTSGYLAPSVDILVPDNSLSEKRVVEEIFGDLRLPASYVTKFCQGDINNFHRILFNKGGYTLAARRTFNVYKTRQADSTSTFCSYADNYVTYPTGAVYRRVDSDPRFSIVNKVIKLNSRTNTEMQKDLEPNTPINVWWGKDNEKKEFWFTGYSGLKDNREAEGTYIRLTTKEPISGQPKQKENGKWTIMLDKKDAVEDYIQKNWEVRIPHGMMRDFRDKVDDEVQRTMPAPEEAYKKGKHVQYVIFGDLYNVEYKGGKFNLTKTNKIDKEAPEVYAHPAIYLKRTDFLVKDNLLTMRRTNPYLENANVFYSGINNTLISRMLDEDGATENLNKIPNGSRIIIQDVVYTKKSKHLVSDPITTDGFASKLRNAEKSGSAEKEVLSLYQGLTIDYSTRKEGLTADHSDDEDANAPSAPETEEGESETPNPGTDKKVPFTSYIKDAGVGELLDKNKADGTMYKRGNSLKYADGEGEPRAFSGQVPKTAPVYIVATNDLKFRKIDGSKNIYELVTSTDKFSEGYIDDASMFYETLDLSVSDDFYMNMIGNKFAPVDNAQKYIDGFMREYKDALMSDTKSMLKFWLVIIMSYFYVMSWICYCVLRFDVGRGFLTELRDISDGWFDLVKIFTFGMLNLDSELKASTVLVGNVCMIFVLTLIFRYL